MVLSDHFRELRARMIRAAIFYVIAFSVLLFFYQDLLELVMAPYNQARLALGEGVKTTPYIKSATGPLMLPLKLAGVAGLVVSAPYWLAQIWGFIVPGLHPQEKKWTRVFVAIAGPLFLIGVATCYYILPRALEVLIGFTPSSMENLVEFGEYFSFLTRMLLVFGVAFEIPLFVIMLNLAGVVTGQQIGRYRAWIVVGTFVFAAAATPSTDPFSMLALAVPMTLLFLIAELIARFLDRSRGTRRDAASQLSDDEASPL